MKLFLASTFADVVSLFVKRVKSGTVLFIANAADPFKNKLWVKKDFRAFIDNGFDVDRIDLREMNAANLRSFIHEYNILHLCGGSAIYLLNLLREKKVAGVIVDAIKENGLIYTGTSAGSMIMAPDISFCADDEDEQEAGMVGKLKSLKGLGLIPYFIMCHCQNRYYVPSTVKAMKQLPKNKLPILLLNDGMAIWHEDGKMEIVSL
jgi:dipeptidase E